MEANTGSIPESTRRGGPFISVVIPNRNGARTIGKCLDSVYASNYRYFEAIVVDDCSTDGSHLVIGKYPCRLVRLEEHGGASRARNTGARLAKGEALFFVDSDCVLLPETLGVAARAYTENMGAVTGGTYTPRPHDRGFYGTFQSVFVNYFETKRAEPDYVATHAMVVGRGLFEERGGFDEDFMPILEDVEFSHRARRNGVRLTMHPGLLVEHIFDFSLSKSLKNAVRKSMYWTMYSIKKGDILSDSGTASLELKANTASWFLCCLLAALYVFTDSRPVIVSCGAALGANLILNRGLISAFFKTGGAAFGLLATAYYTAVYPAAVATGGALGAARAR